MRLPDWLAHRAATAGERLAIIAGDVRWTFQELDRRAASLARRMVGLGVRPGDRVALLLPNGPEFVELAHGVGRAGGILVPLNTRLAPPELAWQLGHAAPRAFVYAPQTEPAARAALARWAQEGQTGGEAASSEVAVLSTEELASAPEAADASLRPFVELEAVHSILYTSGTTGRPKGALLTYGNYWWSAVGSALNLGLCAGDRWLANLPLFHVGGLSILVRGVIYGMTAVVHPRFDPQAANRAIDEEGVTLLSVVATTLARMLDARGERPYPPSLRAVLVGGGPVPVALLERAARLGMPVVQTYGLTEAASQVTTLPPGQALRKLGSAGRPLLPTEVRIERDGRPAGPGEVGEILVRGPTVSPGYFREAPVAAAGRDGAGQDAASLSARRDGGWLRTGDLGYLDEEGYLYVVDRRDDLIVSGGENVYPAEVEAALLAHPAIQEAGVVGIPHPEWGQVPVAAVRLRAGWGLTAEELLAHCAGRLARYKVPKEVRIVQAPLPRNAAGKLLRSRLREQWLEAGAGGGGRGQEVSPGEP
ncbi:o-succinylbenzoate--CoA ligase [Carboxydochorda subterranea]|uniref:2-succinylbenzoate--CoA ligase n=1 Tax=Carboxydichorda subterranea TaxID=3109565 RepID=A0ABZ1BXC4_9FIRM|nr:o-succinylbenzoate--CoA ligase [Limnochorda sp. L945t]WRP17455.1 o-succinylbenzoate--CoA ligase [Limnochorda sp. L945t]